MEGQKNELTKKQSDTLEFIKQKIEADKMPPTIKEICDRFGLASTNGVHQRLKALEKKGCLKRISKGASRGIIITDRASSVEKTMPDGGERCKTLTIIGDGDAEDPMSVFFSNKGRIAIDLEYFKATGRLFAAVAGDDAMIGAGIAAGDLLIVSHEKDASDGELVIALSGAETIVREYRKTGDGFELRAGAKGYKTIRSCDEEPAILGKIIGLIKKF